MDDTLQSASVLAVAAADQMVKEELRMDLIVAVQQVESPLLCFLGH